MSAYYVSITDGGVYVKEGSFFVEQGGLKEPWGRHWERIDASCLYDARNQGIKLRRARFPSCHKTMGENGEPPESYWPEAAGH